jgi:hypothetical protein
MAGVGVACLTIVVVSCLVYEDGKELIDERVDEPFFASSFGADYEAGAASGFRWEEITLVLFSERN